MNVLFISIDSLRRDFLGAYRDRPTILDYDVETANLDRFADRAAVFERHYAGSLPCMPARREWLTGIREFLWRPWGPIEPFDSTIPEIARLHGTLTQLITDHYHYFQHGSHGYYEDYNGFQFIRGHEYDAWRTAPQIPDERLRRQIGDRSPDPPDETGYINRAQYARNVADFDESDEGDFFGPKVFAEVSEWLRDNGGWCDWYCFVDSFDVHEPFHLPEPYASMYTDLDPRDPSLPVWPYYGRIDSGQSKLNDDELAFVQSQFAGKVTMVDRWFGRVLDTLDDLELWDDTVVIMTSDHGFMLGDHGWMGKNDMPVYDVIANTPLLIWHPHASRTGDRIDTLTSAVDLYATVLETLDLPVPAETHSRSLLPVLEDEVERVRDRVLFGYWGSSVNVTDGQYTYMHPCNPSVPTDCYSTTMMDTRSSFTPVTPKPDAEAAPFLPYTDIPVWRFQGQSFAQLETAMLYDTDTDPRQQTNLINESGHTGRMRDLLRDAMTQMSVPEQQFARLDLDPT